MTLSEMVKELEDAKAKHEARVQELLERNGKLLERARAAERSLGGIDYDDLARLLVDLENAIVYPSRENTHGARAALFEAREFMKLVRAYYVAQLGRLPNG